MNIRLRWYCNARQSVLVSPNQYMSVLVCTWSSRRWCVLFSPISDGLFRSFPSSPGQCQSWSVPVSDGLYQFETFEKKNTKTKRQTQCKYTHRNTKIHDHNNIQRQKCKSCLNPAGTMKMKRKKFARSRRINKFLQNA